MPAKAPRKKSSRKRYSRAVRSRRLNSVSNPERSRESTLFAPIGKFLGGAAGGFLGGPAGAALGSTLGSTAGSLISRLTGFGNYKVKRNTLIDDSIPQFQSRMGDGCIRIRHKEFISDVVSSATPGLFNPVTYGVSSSNANTFPFLSSIAVNFEEFAFEGLVFEYITSSGSLSTTGQLGTVVGAMQYNSLALPYTNKQQMEASTYGESTVASQSCLFPIECDAAQTPSNGIFYNIRAGMSSVNNDPRWSQLGNFTLATVGMPAASENVGELYVAYDVVLMKPILVQNSGSLADHWYNDTAIDTTNYFGTSPTLSAQSDNFTLLGPSTIYFSSAFNGKVAITYAIVGAAGAWLHPDFNPGVGATAVVIYNNFTQNQLAYTTSNVNDSTLTTVYYDLVAQPAGSGLPAGYGSSILLASGTFFTPTWVDLLISQVPSDFL